MKSKTKAPKTKHKTPKASGMTSSTSTSMAATSTNPPPASKSSSSYDTLKLGRIVTIADRLRWIRIPRKNNKRDNPKQGFEYWPGVIYKSYSELIKDVKYTDKCSRKFQAQCLLRQHQLEKDQPSTRLSMLVAVVFCGESYMLREFEDCTLIQSIVQELNHPDNAQYMDEVTEERIQPFYPYYEQNYNLGIKNDSRMLGSKKRGSFDDAIQTVLMLLGEQEEEDDSPIFVMNEEFYSRFDGGKASKTLVSPDGFEKEGDCEKEMRVGSINGKKNTKVISRNTEEDHQDEESTDAGESFFGDDNESKEDEGLIHDEYDYDEKSEDGRTPENEGGAHLTQSPQQSESSLQSINSESPIRANDPWSDVWKKMRGMGWHWMYKKEDVVYFHDDEPKKYFREEELQDFAEREFGWKNPENEIGKRNRKRKKPDLFSSEGKGTESRKKKDDDSPGDKKKYSTNPNKRGKGGKKRDKKKPSKRNWGIVKYTSPAKGGSQLNFGFVWNFLKKKGWKHIKATNPLHDWYYLKPGVQRGKKEVHGKEGEDYFISREDLLQYIYKNDHLLGSPATSSTESESEVETTPTSSVNPDGNSSADNSSNYGSPESSVTNIYTTPDGKPDRTSDCDESSYGSQINDQDESAWWLSSPIPNFSKEIWPLLKSIIPYKNACYVVKRSGKEYRMESVEEMQIFLCKNGLELHEGHGFDENDLEIISRWISLAQLPRKMTGKSLRPENSLTMLCRVPILDSEDAWSYLSKNYECEMYDNGRIRAPLVGCNPLEEDDKVCFDSIEDLRSSIRCRGLQSKQQDPILVGIMLWASLSPVDPFVVVSDQAKGAVDHPKSQSDDRHTGRGENKNDSSVSENGRPTTSSITVPEADNENKKLHDATSADDLKDAIDSAENENDKGYYDSEYFNQEERKEELNSGSLLTQDVMDGMSSNEFLDTVLPFQQSAKCSTLKKSSRNEIRKDLFKE